MKKVPSLTLTEYYRLLFACLILFLSGCSSDSSVPGEEEEDIEDPAYVSKLKERWGQLRGGSLSNSAIFGRIDTYTTALNQSGAAEANFNLWPVLGTYVWPNNFVGNTYAEELDYLTDWINDRLSWMDTQIDAL